MEVKKNGLATTILGFLLLIGLGYWLFSTQNLDENGKNNVTPVTVAEAKIMTLADTIEALGTANANESLDVTTSVTETISQLHFEEGQDIKAGDPIVSFAQAEEAAELAAAQARVSEQQRELRRLRPLLKTNAVSQRIYDERKTLLEVAKRDMERVKARISDRTITAPFSGTLGLRHFSVGSLVEPGDVITTLDDLSIIKLDFTLPETFLGVVKPGREVTATTEALKNTDFRATVSTVDSRVDPVSRSFTVRALIDNEERLLKPGMLMQVNLQNNPRQALMIPEEALIPRQDKQYVFVVNTENKVVEKEVTIGSRKPGKVEITGGLEAGERVITRGITQVRPGQQVTVQEKNVTVDGKLDTSISETTGQAAQ
jgi:membrane fusion protein (multidrug efflux system)